MEVRGAFARELVATGLRRHVDATGVNRGAVVVNRGEIMRERAASARDSSPEARAKGTPPAAGAGHGYAGDEEPRRLGVASVTDRAQQAPGLRAQHVHRSERIFPSFKALAEINALVVSQRDLARVLRGGGQKRDR